MRVADPAILQLIDGLAPQYSAPVIGGESEMDVAVYEFPQFYVVEVIRLCESCGGTDEVLHFKVPKVIRISALDAVQMALAG